jgi:hypothetical protein
MDLSYPGTYYNNFVPLSSVYLPHAPSGTYGWTRVEENVAVPAGAGFLFFKVFSNGDPGASLYFDQVEYSRGSGWQGFVNGSFEEQSDSSLNPRYFYSWKADTGTAVRTTEQAHDGNWSVKLAGCTAWGHWANYDENWWLGDAAALAVTPGETVSIGYWVRAGNAAADKNGILIWFASASTYYGDRAFVEGNLDNHLVQFSVASDAPVFIGEFTASLAGRRPDILDYIGDAIDCFDARGFSWVYYVYRENWTGPRKYLGVYNGPAGASVEGGGCSEDTDVLDCLRSKY